MLEENATARRGGGLLLSDLLTGGAQYLYGQHPETQDFEEVFVRSTLDQHFYAIVLKAHISYCSKRTILPCSC